MPALAEAARGRAGEAERGPVAVVARAGVRERLQEGARGPRRAEQVDVEHVAHALFVELVQRAVLRRPDAGVRHADVDAAPGFERAFERLGELGGARDVGAQADRLLAPRAVGDQRLELLEAAVSLERQPRALGREGVGDRASDASRGAGQEHDAVFESGLHPSAKMARFSM
ncbi:MAG: hypothetical protein AAF682_08460 [Planctomycetota bacterium]